MTNKRLTLISIAVLITGSFITIMLLLDSSSHTTSDKPKSTPAVIDEVDASRALPEVSPPKNTEKLAYILLDQNVADKLLGSGSVRIQDLNTVARLADDDSKLTISQYKKGNSTVAVSVYEYPSEKAAKTHPAAKASSTSLLAQKGQFVAVVGLVKDGKFDSVGTQALLNEIQRKL